ncbi:MAG: AAA family ATPase [Alphaproteobacteria bacterium]
MINFLTLGNFRAFKRQRFDFSKINIFVGPNNAGKSSALSALNVIAQTLLDYERGAPLVLRGQYDDLGTYIDVVHGNHPNTQIDFEFGIDDFQFNLGYKYKKSRREIDLKKFELLRNSENIYSYYLRNDSYEINYLGRSISDILPDHRKRRPIFRSFLPFDLNTREFRFFSESRKKDGSATEVFDRVDSELRRGARRVRDHFLNFDSLSPFREQPIRTYLYSGVNPNSVGRTGANSIDILVADSFGRGASRESFVDGASKWFEEAGIASELVVKELTSRHFEICVKGMDGREHNLCDVGFGCSQVLPVLIGGLKMGRVGSKMRPPVFLVQEPEIHLHPNAQAELGSFFSFISKGNGQIFVETHSDNMILRIQSHVASGDINPSDVVIYYIYDEGGEKQVRRMNLNKNGFFEEDWPGGFFPYRKDESLRLAKIGGSQLSLKLNSLDR